MKYAKYEWINNNQSEYVRTKAINANIVNRDTMLASLNVEKLTILILQVQNLARKPHIRKEPIKYVKLSSFRKPTTKTY